MKTIPIVCSILLFAIINILGSVPVQEDELSTATVKKHGHFYVYIMAKPVYKYRVLGKLYGQIKDIEKISKQATLKYPKFDGLIFNSLKADTIEVIKLTP